MLMSDLNVFLLENKENQIPTLLKRFWWTTARVDLSQKEFDLWPHPFPPPPILFATPSPMDFSRAPAVGLEFFFWRTGQVPWLDKSYCLQELIREFLMLQFRRFDCKRTLWWRYSRWVWIEYIQTLGNNFVNFSQ